MHRRIVRLDGAAWRSDSHSGREILDLTTIVSPATHDRAVEPACEEGIDSAGHPLPVREQGSGPTPREIERVPSIGVHRCARGVCPMGRPRDSEIQPCARSRWPWSHVVSIDGEPDRSGSPIDLAPGLNGPPRGAAIANRTCRGEGRGMEMLVGLDEAAWSEAAPPLRRITAAIEDIDRTRSPNVRGFASWPAARGECRPPGMRPVPLPRIGPNLEWPGPAGARRFRAGVRRTIRR